MFAQDADTADTFVKQLVDANRSWLLPDWNRRERLVYDYTQEHGHLQQVAFDQHGNCIVVYESPTIFSEDEKSKAAAERHDKPFSLFLAAKNTCAFGNANSTFLQTQIISRPTRLFTGESGRVSLATGWHWQSATTFLGLFPDEFDKTLTETEDGKTLLLTLKPKSRDATLELGTMLFFSSYSYLPNRKYERCEVLIDKATKRPIEEHYFRADEDGKGEEKSFSTVRYSDWFVAAGGQVPGKIEAWQSMGEHKSFSVIAVFRNDNDRWLADKIESTFHETDKPDSGSTGTITIISDATEIDKRLQKVADVLKKIADTTVFLDDIAKYPIERTKTVQFQLNTPVAVQLTGRQDQSYQGGSIGIVDYTAKESDGKTIIDTGIYSTCGNTEYAVTPICRLLDADGKLLAEVEQKGTIRAVTVPTMKTFSLKFENVNLQNVKSIQFDIRIGRLVASNFTGTWYTNEGSSGSGIPVFPNRRDWGPEQAIGEPPLNRYRRDGDFTTAWSPLKPNDGIQWLELHYPRKVTAIGVSIWESFNPGAVIRVTTFDASGNESTAWEGDDPVKISKGWGISPIRFAEPVDTQRIRIYLDTDKVEGWNAIETVRLHSKGGGKHWAIDAEASSSYAVGPKPQSFVFTYEGPLTEIKYDKGYNDGVRYLVGAQQVIEMQRPKDVPYLNAVKILADGFGRNREESKMFVLDADMKILREIVVPPPRGRNEMGWNTFNVPSVEVPETFRIAFQFNSGQSGGVSFATRICDESETSHSFEQKNDSGELLPLKHENSAADWMIRAYLSETPQAKK
jgi:hypothetical protein